MHHPKNEHRVYLKLVSGKVEEGFIYHYDSERLVDVLNDARRFIPFFSKREGKLLVLNKDHVEFVHSLDEHYS